MGSRSPGASVGLPAIRRHRARQPVPDRPRRCPSAGAVARSARGCSFDRQGPARLRIRTMETVFDGSTARRRFNALLIDIFAVLGLVMVNAALRAHSGSLPCGDQFGTREICRLRIPAAIRSSAARSRRLHIQAVWGAGRRLQTPIG